MSRPRTALLVLFAIALAALLLHAWAYRFLTDDAFISFRYARNLAHGDGLVFNPGFERVEGYTNFLWVLLLAAFEAIGIAADRVANLLSLAATVVLFLLVGRASRRAAGPGEPALVTALPCLLLAATRSVAVWSTGGLETRLFELLTLAAVLRLIAEISARERGEAALRPWSGVLFGLAALTRPDGILIGGASMAAAWLRLARPGRLAWREAIPPAVPFAAIVGAHFVFRLAYYGAWLPNTYAAKVAGRTWWSMGGAYLGAFLLEYAAALWLPLVVLGAMRRIRRGEGRVPSVFGAAVLPHLVWIVAIGGDHFEYRPLDLYFPFAFLMVADGVRELRERKGADRSLAALVAALVLGLVWLPLQSHRQYPADRYRPGFPGGSTDDGAAARWLDPARDPLLRWPVLRAWPGAYRLLIARTTARFVGIRQEEHRLFLATVDEEGRRLHDLVAAGRIPATLHVALSSVGAVPYRSGLRTFDRLGLTDAWAARAEVVGEKRMMGHDLRVGLVEHAREIGVDLSAIRAGRLAFPLDDPALLPAIATASVGGSEVAVAEIAPDVFLAGTLPRGLDAVRRDHPGLAMVAVSDPGVLRGLAARAAAALEARVRRDPADDDAALSLGNALVLTGDPRRAAEVLDALVARRPDRISAWTGLAGARAAAGQKDAALAALDRAQTLARTRGATETVRELDGIVRRLGQR